MNKWKGRSALVTGGSKGIGAAIVSALASHGVQVFACARNIQPITEAAQALESTEGKIIPIACDFQHPDQVVKMFEEIRNQSGGVDILVNNCGIALPGSLKGTDIESMQKMLNVNVLALSICAQEAVRSMRERSVNDGYVIHINSSSGQRVSSNATLHFYSATKFAVTALTEGLRQELNQLKSKIRVTSICPGLTDTPGLDSFNSPEEKEKLFEKIGNITMEPKDVADAVIHVLSFPGHVQIHELSVRPIFQ